MADDERTWGTQGFQDLIEKGILWAVSDDARNRLAALALNHSNTAPLSFLDYEQRPGRNCSSCRFRREESVKRYSNPG